MILDSSALVAVILREPGCEAVLAHLETAGALGVGAPTLSETSIVLAARLGRDPRPNIARLLQEYQVTVVPFTDAHWVESTEAFLAYGKGRHPAALDYGDCLTYAVAKLSGEALLATGDDFTRTDLGVVAL